MKTWKLADTLKHSMGSTHRTNAKWDKEFHMQWKSNSSQHHHLEEDLQKMLSAFVFKQQKHVEASELCLPVDETKWCMSNIVQ